MSLDKTLVNKVLSEFVGTFTLASIVVVMAQTIGQPFLTGLAAALVLATFYTTVGAVSGAHLNPAVTLGFFSLRKINLRDTVAYIIFQLLGGFAALHFVQYMYGAKLPGTITFGKLNGKVFIAELVGAAVFTWGIAAVVSRKIEGYQAAAAIGTSLFLGVMLAGMSKDAGYINAAVALANKGLNVNTALAPVVGSVFAMNLVNVLGANETPVTAPATASSGRKSAAKTSRTKKK